MSFQIWDLISYALTAQLLFLVAGHARRSVSSLAGILSLARNFFLSVLCHLLAVFVASYLESSSSAEATASADAPIPTSAVEESVYPFQISAGSVALLTFALLLAESFLDAVAWIDAVFIPMVQGVKNGFYFEWKDRRRVLEPLAVAHAPGVDLRGKMMNP